MRVLPARFLDPVGASGVSGRGGASRDRRLSALRTLRSLRGGGSDTATSILYGDCYPDGAGMKRERGEGEREGLKKKRGIGDAAPQAMQDMGKSGWGRGDKVGGVKIGRERGKG